MVLNIMLIRDFLKRQSDYKTPGTIAWKTRQRRMKDFNKWFESVFIYYPVDDKSIPTISIIDVGGTPDYWNYLDFKYINKVKITTLNIDIMDVPKGSNGSILSVKGDAVDLREFEDKKFDLAFSNSVIEHVGDVNHQQRMADEMRRVARHGYLQTPNKWFFIEPHFLFPFFSLLPLRIREELVYRFKLGHYSKAKTRDEARRIASSINLLSAGELKKLFPGTTLDKEKMGILNKSFIIKW